MARRDSKREPPGAADYFAKKRRCPEGGFCPGGDCRGKEPQIS